MEEEFFPKITDLEKGSNFTLNVAKHINNVFLKKILVVWRKIQRKHISNTVEDIVTSCIWENDVFKTTKTATTTTKQNKTNISLKTWYKAGIYYVNDLVRIEGGFMTLIDLKITYGLQSFFFFLNITESLVQLRTL